MRKSNGFRWKALSQRQKQVLSWWTPQSTYSGYNGIIADGAIRSGKTFAMSFSFVQWAMTCYSGQQFAMCGKTIASFRRNVLGTLKQQLAARGYNVKEHRAENCMTVSKGGRTNEFYFFGGKDESSQDLIQGITLAGAFFDEVALMPQSFVNQATARCSVTGSKFWFNCNPGSPQHWFYIEWVRKCRSRRMMYLHFTMDDNLSLAEDIKERYRSQYSGVFYQRFILGLWTVAEGLVYDMFDRQKHIIDKLPELSPKGAYVACDFGTQNATVFLLFRMQSDTGTWIATREYYYSGREQKRQKTVGEYVADLKRWLNGTKPEKVIVDPSALPLITELKQNGLPIQAANNDVLSGILDVQTMLQTGRLKIYRECKRTIQEFGVYAWDPDREDVVIKENDHCMDSIRYALQSVCVSDADILRPANAGQPRSTQAGGRLSVSHDAAADSSDSTGYALHHLGTGRRRRKSLYGRRRQQRVADGQRKQRFLHQEHRRQRDAASPPGV